MEKEWIKDKDGYNLKFKREDLLNYGVDRWQLNRPHSVGSVMELIQRHRPKDYEDWVYIYFRYAFQDKNNGIKVDQDYLKKLGEKLYNNLKNELQNELDSILRDKEECVDYIYNLVINRTYEGYHREIDAINVICEKLKDELNITIEHASDEIDRSYHVDYIIPIESKSIGLQIKPVSSGRTLKDYQIDQIHEDGHKRFREKFGGNVFFVFSNKKKIANPKVIDEIRQEIRRLQQES